MDSIHEQGTRVTYAGNGETGTVTGFDAASGLYGLELDGRQGWFEATHDELKVLDTETVEPSNTNPDGDADAEGAAPKAAKKAKAPKPPKTTDEVPEVPEV